MIVPFGWAMALVGIGMAGLVITVIFSVRAFWPNRNENSATLSEDPTSGYGAVATGNARIHITGGSASGNRKSGLHAAHDAEIRASETRLDNNGETG
jgi:hypothetical protein